MEPKYIPQYSLKHVAHMVGVSPKTVRRWIKAGRLDAYRVGGRNSWYMDLHEINKMREVYALPPLTVDESRRLFNEY